MLCSFESAIIYWKIVGDEFSPSVSVAPPVAWKRAGGEFIELALTMLYFPLPVYNTRFADWR
jgi:hypothetical protein